jgi:hypothetical protein
MSEYDTHGIYLCGHFKDNVICVPPILAEPDALGYGICEAITTYKVWDRS